MDLHVITSRVASTRAACTGSNAGPEGASRHRVLKKHDSCSSELCSIAAAVDDALYQFGMLAPLAAALDLAPDDVWGCTAQEEATDQPRPK